MRSFLGKFSSFALAQAAFFCSIAKKIKNRFSRYSKCDRNGAKIKNLNEYLILIKKSIFKVNAIETAQKIKYHKSYLILLNISS